MSPSIVCGLHSLSFRTVVAASALAVFSLTMVAGCGSTTAAPPSATREAAWGLLGVNLTLVNNSGQAITLTSLVSDSSQGLGNLPNGGTASIEGTGPPVQTDAAKDVQIAVTFSDGAALDLDAWNPFIGYPTVKESGCFGPGYKVGDKRDWNFKGRGITVERRADDEWIQFAITFTATNAAASPDICSERVADVRVDS